MPVFRPFLVGASDLMEAWRIGAGEDRYGDGGQNQSVS